MANIKVSEMTQADSVNDIDLLMIVQGSTNKKVTKQTLMKNINTEITNIKSEQVTQNTKIQANTTAIETKASQSDLDAVETDIQTNRANITALQTENNNLRKALPNIKGTGTDITLNNTSENKFNDLVVGGNTEQEQLTGKNLLGLVDGTYTNNGITAVVSNGKITLNGTATNTSFIPINLLKNIELSNQTVTVSINNSTTAGDNLTELRVYTSGTNYLACDFSPINNSASYANKTDTYEKIQIRTSSGITYNNFVIKPQLELNATATPYEPYCGRYSSTKSTVMNVLLKMLQVM